MNGDPQTAPLPNLVTGAAMTNLPPVSTTGTPPHVALVDRVADLEAALAALTDQHNRFVHDAARELGI